MIESPSIITSRNTSDSRRRCILVSTCIGTGLKYLLQLSEEFNRTYMINSFITDQHWKYMKDFNVSEEAVGTCDLLLHLTPGWADWGNEAAYADLLNRFPPSIQKISFPYPMLNTLWPFHCGDHRNDDPNRPRNAHGEQPTYPYGDSMVLSMIKEGRPKQEIIEVYATIDVTQRVDLDERHRRCMDWQLGKEEHTDVKVLGFINDITVRTFSTINHVSNATLIHMADQILAMLTFKPLTRYAHEALFELIEPQMPIHPSIIRGLGLPYVTPASRYKVDARRNLTFMEYLDQYIDFA